MPSKKRTQFQRASVPSSVEVNPSSILSAPWHSSWVYDWPGVDIHLDKRCQNHHFFARHALRENQQQSFLPRLHTINNPRKQYKDLIYILLNMRWVPFTMILVGVYFGMCSVFALFLKSCGDYDSFQNNFDLSFQTMATIGFGVLYPKSRCANYVIIAQAIVSMLLLAALSGMVFAKFAKPKAKMAFSSVCCVQPYGKDKLALVFRVANATRSSDVTRDVIMDASFSLHLMRIEKSVSADKLVMRQYPLTLLQSNYITFRMAMALVHVIDVDSPLHGLTQDTLLQSEMIFQVSMTGVDSTLQDTVIERRLYTVEMIRWGEKFAEMLDFDEQTSVVSVDFATLSSTVSAPIAPAARSFRHKENTLAHTTRVRAQPSESELLVSSPTPKMSWASSQRRILQRMQSPGIQSADMEPLFEPLLQPSIGIQRLRNIRRASQDIDMVPQQLVRLRQQLAGTESLTTSDDVDNDNDDFYEQEEDKVLISSVNSRHSVEITNTPRFVRVHSKNVPMSYSFMSFYYTALHMKWPRILIMIVGSSLLVNTIFAALLYANYADGIVASEAVTNGSHPFEVAFYLSLHAWGTIGYGSVAPNPDNTLSNIWVAIESILSVIFVTIFTGIAWSKFARPRAHIHFSQNIVLSTYNGHKCLLLRAANTRHHGDIRESNFRMGVILSNSKTGLRQMQDVPLVNPQWPSILLPVTLVHIIDENSPFHQFQTPEDFSAHRVSVITLFTGLDSTFAENVYARKTYFWDDFVMSKHFENTVDFTPDHVTVDYNKFDSLVDDDIPFHLQV
ncbi:Aste57867_22016 [Aphanomyces stellatus]|uniref:Aste57867_22016 protein n=1 Tax=Aphanomyces stellatus TaxID=120398 RepID=A0A485LJS0_9STRA|nr:hypothetical protein As57867_021947 [Aphanomyces stellatus]VFT98684.1 Aste57867_22016 [Aphanomyces stellatus]